MNNSTIMISNKRLHVEMFGTKDNPAVLYLHGGPGESCYDFTYHQAERLSEDFFVIAIDQRGVCRSEMIREAEDFGLMDLVEDCEALRIELGIERWSLIGHSFGGFLSLLYASTYPTSIEKMIVECPTFDFELTSRNLLRKTAQLLKKYGKEDASALCLEAAASGRSSKEITEMYGKLSDELGEHRMEIYRFNHDHPTDYYAAYTEEQWEEFYDRSEVHYKRLMDEGEIFTSLLPKLKEVNQPMLLMLGKHDAVTCDVQIEAFHTDVQNGETILFENSGHTPHYEEPEKFKEVVCAFLSKREESINKTFAL
ncbi:alpha/beta hydrolase [Fictibacillus nanhaiensis]|uniref:alpha/beta fold hydrolase n=1 Tax=Fictibacillus nanhaiensis TaxID=742169 RepID=UPI001C98743A|nr:alpha/beta hydrolase [Fictibacillus nanhaiensis]MBY6036632.1 alpha/beta hydrolase [Fictibacillus nanhaiensis]